MTGDYRDLTPEQLRQELVARDARIIQLQNANDDERRAREKLQSAVNYLYEQQLWSVNTTDPRQLRDQLIRHGWVQANPPNADRRTREHLAVIRRRSANTFYVSFFQRNITQMSSHVSNYLGTSSGQLPGNVRITPDGTMVSVIDVIMVVSFTDDNGRLKKSAQKNASDYNKILLRDHPEVSLLQRNFRFAGQGQRDTPVAARKGIFQIIQLLRGKKASKFRESVAGLVAQYLDADMGLADDITNRALQAHMADLKAAKGSSAEGSGEIPRLKSRDGTKELGQTIKQIGAV